LITVDDSQFPLVKVTASLSDGNGIPIRGMVDPNLWLVQEGATSAEIVSVEELAGDQLPLALVFAVDISGSMAGEPLAKVRQAAEYLINHSLGPTDQIALVIFSDDIQTVVPLSTNHADLISAWPTTAKGQRTRLYDALAHALRELRTAPPGKRAVLLFTDGEDIGSSLALDDVLREASQMGVPISVVGYGTQERLKPQVLRRLAVSTGGIAQVAASPDEIPGKFQDIFTSLRAAYAISYLSQMPADSGRHEFRLTFSQSGQSAEAVGFVTARPGNFDVTLTINNLPPRELAERVWQAMEQSPIGPEGVYVSGAVSLVPDSPHPGRLEDASYFLDGTLLGHGVGDAKTLEWDSSQASPGLYNLQLQATDHVGNRISKTLPVAIVPAAYAKFTSPLPGATLTSTVPVHVEITSIDTVQEIVLYASDRELDRKTGLSGNLLTYEYPWNVRQVAEGEYRLRIEVITSKGKSLAYETPVHIGPHVVVQFQAPAEQAQLKGQEEVRVLVDSDAPVEYVRFFVNEQMVSEDTSVPYSCIIDTRNFPPKPATIRAEARNIHGFIGTASIQVNMIPGGQSGIVLVIIGGLMVALLPIIWITIRRTRARQPRPSGVRPTAAGPGTQPKVGNAGWLIGERGTVSNQRFPLRWGENRLGRDSRFADIVISDPKVSRQHAVITVTTQGATFVNQNDYNPSFINGRPVTQARPLRDGDRIQLGDCVLRFQQEM